MENATEDKSKINNQNVENDNNTYNWGLDLIRVLAMFFVILVHSTSFYGFAGAEISSFSTFMAGIGRYLSYTCIPLFLILTGFGISKISSFSGYTYFGIPPEMISPFITDS